MSAAQQNESHFVSACASGAPLGARLPPPGSEPMSIAEEAAGEGACSGSEVFALRVLGTSMEPEFLEGEIILIEPEGLLRDGSFVLTQQDGEWIFRQLCQQASGWALHALNPNFADRPLADLSAVRGVIIQKALPGRRRASKRYA